MKKRVLSLALAVLLALALAGCGGEDSTGDTAQQEDTSAAGVETTQPEEETPASAATVGSYDVEIKDAFMATDYEGNPAIVVTYSWTNNGTETTSAIVALHDKAFQDGVQLEVAMMDVVDGYDAGASMLDVQPGGTQDFQQAYVCTSETSPVQVTIEEFMGDGTTAEKTFDITALT